MNIEELIKEYKYKIELHAHTSPVSACGDVLAEEVVRIYAEAGVDALVITNHLSPWFLGTVDEYIDDYYRAKLTGDKLGINVIFGCEIRFEENANDYLVFGISPEDIEAMKTYIPKTIHEFYKEFKNDKNVILQAHPFRKGMVLASLEDIDGIESFNLHPNHNSSIGYAAKYAKEHGMLVSCGSDYHHLGHHAMALLRSKTLPENSYELAEILKSRDYLFDLSGHIVFPYC